MHPFLTKNSTVDWATVMRVLAGGSLLGAGVGAGTSILNHLKTLQDKANESQAPGADNVLYLNLRQPELSKRAHANNALTFAGAAGAGLAGIYGGYDLVRSIHQKMRAAQLQKELASAQQIYLDNLGVQATHQKAASQFSLLTKGVGSMYLASLLTALGSGVVANRILQKQFPAVRDPNRDRPKRIVIRSVSPAGKPVGDEDVEPMPQNQSPEAVESLLRTQLAHPKAASASGFAAMVQTAALGKSASLKAILQRESDDNVLALMACMDEVPRVKVSSVKRNLAVSWIAHDPLVSSAVAPLLAAEFADWGEPYFKMAAVLDRDCPDVADDLVKLAELITVGMRHGAYIKVAQHAKIAEHDLPGPFKAIFMADALHKMMANGQEGELQLDSANSNISPSQDSPGDLSVSDDDAADFVRQNHGLLNNSQALAA